jgi:hypothetical protein
MEDHGKNRPEKVKTNIHGGCYKCSRDPETLLSNTKYFENLKVKALQAVNVECKPDQWIVNRCDRDQLAMMLTGEGIVPDKATFYLRLSNTSLLIEMIEKYLVNTGQVEGDLFLLDKVNRHPKLAIYDVLDDGHRLPHRALDPV